jgi:hypothetical protein
MSTSEEEPRPVLLEGSGNGELKPAVVPAPPVPHVPVASKPEENIPAVRWQAVLGICIGIVGPLAIVLLLAR